VTLVHFLLLHLCFVVAPPGVSENSASGKKTPLVAGGNGVSHANKQGPQGNCLCCLVIVILFFIFFLSRSDQKGLYFHQILSWIIW